MPHFFDRTINLWPSVIQAIQVTCYNVNKLLYADGTVQMAENAGLHQMLNIVVREMHKERNKKNVFKYEENRNNAYIKEIYNTNKRH